MCLPLLQLLRIEKRGFLLSKKIPKLELLIALLITNLLARYLLLQFYSAYPIFGKYFISRTVN